MHKEYFPFMFLRIHKADELRVQMLKDNIEIEIKERALLTT
jgi:hypothetical protein